MLIKEEEICTQYSGINNQGKNIMGILKYKNKCFDVDDILKWYANSEWSLQEAAKIPLAYSMVKVNFIILILILIPHIRVIGLLLLGNQSMC